MQRASTSCFYNQKQSTVLSLRTVKTLLCSRVSFYEGKLLWGQVSERWWDEVSTMCLLEPTVVHIKSGFNFLFVKVCFRLYLSSQTKKKRRSKEQTAIFFLFVCFFSLTDFPLLFKVKEGIICVLFLSSWNTGKFLRAIFREVIKWMRWKVCLAVFFFFTRHCWILGQVWWHSRTPPLFFLKMKSVSGNSNENDGQNIIQEDSVYDIGTVG